MKHYPGAVSSIILGVVCNSIMVQYIIISEIVVENSFVFGL